MGFFSFLDWNDDPEPIDGSDDEGEDTPQNEITVDDGEHFVDAGFDADNTLGCDDLQDVEEWKRPHELAEDCAMYVDGSNQMDIRQGELGDCWFLAALATIAQNQEILMRCAPVQPLSPEEEGYNGLLKFRFYQYGKWVTVPIDDRLATKNGGRLKFAKSTDCEYWTPLIEKAYAKLNGSYKNLSGGHVTEAMVDLTGGTGERITLDDQTCQSIFQDICEALDENSLIGTSKMGIEGQTEPVFENGLVGGHAYTVTGANVFTTEDGEQYRCVRVRNPWGSQEWNGAWCDSDPIWETVTESMYDQYLPENKNNGEFWMEVEEYRREFHDLEICRLCPDDDEAEGRWHMEQMNGEWSEDLGTNGGCPNDREAFMNNPFHAFRIDGGDASDEVMIALQQKHRRKQKNAGMKPLATGFYIFRSNLDLDEIVPGETPLSDCIDSIYSNMVHKPKTFSWYRDITERVKLPEGGTYLVVPCAFSPEMQGKFFMRVFVERPGRPKKHYWSGTEGDEAVEAIMNDSVNKRQQVEEQEEDDELNDMEEFVSNILRSFF